MTNLKKDNRVKIYIAGPDVFAKDDIEAGRKKVEICEKYGFVGLYPTFLLPDDIFSGKYDKDYVGEVVNKGCIQGIKDCDIIVGNMTPFRGYEMDSGTAFEMGVAKALDKVMYGYSMDNRTYIERMTESGGGVFYDQNKTPRDKDGYTIEDVNEGENSMISKSCVAKVVTPGKGEELSIIELFEKTIIMIKCDLELKSKISNKSSNVENSQAKNSM